MLEKMLKFDEGSKLTVYWDTYKKSEQQKVVQASKLHRLQSGLIDNIRAADKGNTKLLSSQNTNRNSKGQAYPLPLLSTTGDTKWQLIT